MAGMSSAAFKTSVFCVCRELDDPIESRVEKVKLFVRIFTEEIYTKKKYEGINDDSMSSSD